MPRQFTVNYNPYTESVQVLDSQEKIVDVIQDVKSNLDMLMNAMKKMV